MEANKLDFTPYDIHSDEENEMSFGLAGAKDRKFTRKVNHHLHDNRVAVSPLATSQLEKQTSHATPEVSRPVHADDDDDDKKDDDNGDKDVTNKDKADATLPPSGAAAAAVGYVYSRELLLRCNKMVQIPGRARLVHSLVESYGLLGSLYLESSNDEKVAKIFPPRLATLDELLSFHDSAFINYLRELNDDVVDEDDEIDDDGAEAEFFGLAYDCPPVARTYDFVRLVVGASLTAARALTSRACRVAINWFGGWHHARRDAAAGFCYANDVVIAIQELKATFGKILYVDLDLHHGDGVQEAFRHTDAVCTVSLHKFVPGFFPGTGGVDEVGSGKGRDCCVNVPLKDGIGDEKYVDIFKRVLTTKVLRENGFQPGATVIQCGADGLFGDPHRAFNLTPAALIGCVEFLRERLAVPTLLLGGGGYNHANVAKCWTRLTAAVLEKEIPEDIPDRCSQFEKFGPDYTINVTPGYIKDENTEEYLDTVIINSIYGEP